MQGNIFIQAGPQEGLRAELDGTGVTHHRPALTQLRPAQEDARRGGQALDRLAAELDDTRSRLSQAQEQLHTTLNSIRHGIMIFSRGGTVQLCNARAAKLLQLPPRFSDGAFDIQDVTAILTTPDVMPGSDGQTATIQRDDGQVIKIQMDRLAGGGKVLLVEDITAERRREEILYLAESEYRSLFENAVCGIYRDRPDGTPVRANRALVNFNGYDTEAEYRAAVKLNGGNWYVDPDRPRLFQQLMEQDGEVRDLVSEVYSHRTRKNFWITENAWYVRDQLGKPVYIEGTIQDATERVLGLAEIERQANTDPLTGAASRFHFMNTLNDITRDLSGTCVLFTIDLDKFKEVNDMLGHSAGDAVLNTVARRLKSVAGAAATVARLGGDEFAVLMSGASAAMKADMISAEIVNAMRQPIEIEGHNAIIGASVGVALFPAHAANSMELLNHADMALYHAKSNGKSKACIFDHAMKNRLQQRNALEAELREAIPANTLELYYQPIVGTNTTQVHGFEALMRWNHPRRGFLQPGQFLDVAEEAGLMTELGNWAIRRACRQAVALPANINMAVNVSPSQFRSSGIVDHVKRALADTGLDASRLTLELTENVLMSSETVAARVMDQLTELGVKLALDDFGTGYSSLSYLQRFAFSKVKIDRSFVAGLETKPANAAIIRAIIRLAGDLGMEVVAEGIETETQAALLRAEGCDFLQGYLFGKPKPFLEIATELALHNLREHLPLKPNMFSETQDQKRAVHNGM